MSIASRRARYCNSLKNCQLTPLFLLLYSCTANTNHQRSTVETTGDALDDDYVSDDNVISDTENKRKKHRKK